MDQKLIIKSLIEDLTRVLGKLVVALSFGEGDELSRDATIKRKE